MEHRATCCKATSPSSIGVGDTLGTSLVQTYLESSLWCCHWLNLQRIVSKVCGNSIKISAQLHTDESKVLSHPIAAATLVVTDTLAMGRQCAPAAHFSPLPTDIILCKWDIRFRGCLANKRADHVEGGCGERKSVRDTTAKIAFNSLRGFPI